MMSNELTKRSDLFREYARVMDMCEGTNVKPEDAWKIDGVIKSCKPWFYSNIEHYEFAIAIVEDRPVFMGDVLWFGNQKRTILSVGREGVYFETDVGITRVDCLSWQEPKLTITINGNEYHVPSKNQCAIFCMPNVQGYYFDTIKDAEDVYKAIVDLLNGK